MYDSKIPDFQTLRERLATSTLVAFDTEGVRQHFEGRTIGSDDISELGVAVFPPGEGCLHLLRNLFQFYDDNNIEAFTIRVYERSYGPAVRMMTERSPKEAGPRRFEFLSSFEGDRILLGFDMYFEWKWISRQYPSFAKLFTSWCDVQELVSQRYVQLPSQPDTLAPECPVRSLASTLKAMSFYGWTRNHQIHGRAADAVKVLAVLSGLLSDAPLRAMGKSFRRIPTYRETT